MMMMMMMKKKKKKEKSKSILDLITNMSSSMSMFVQRKFCDKVVHLVSFSGWSFFFSAICARTSLHPWIHGLMQRRAVN